MIMEPGIILFAQSDPDPKAFLQFWLIIGLLATVGVNVVTLVVTLINRKQKREVNFAFEPASREEFDKHVEWNRREHENLFAKIGGVERGSNGRMAELNKEWHALVESKFVALLGADNEARGKIHARINTIEKELGGVASGMTIQNQQLARIDSKLDRLSEKRS